MEPLTESLIEQQIIKLGITKWNIHNCPFCNYKCGYLFEVDSGRILVKYDNGCYCYSCMPKSRSLQRVIRHIEMQSNPEVIQKYREFFVI